MCNMLSQASVRRMPLTELLLVLALLATRSQSAPAQSTTKTANQREQQPSALFVLPQRLTQPGDSWHAATQHSYRSNKGELFYRITAYRRSFDLHLMPDSRFIAPNFHVVDNSADNETLLSSLEQQDLRSCFYTGFVAGEEGSQVTCSVCGGLHGVVSLSDGSHFTIEPVDHLADGDWDRSHIFRRLARGSSHATPTCGQSNTQSRNSIPIASHPYKLRTAPGGSVQALKTPTRDRRSFSWTRNVETMVVADASMYDFYHGNQLKLRKYLLAVMAVVTGIFKDASIGNDIAISVVKLVILKKDPNELSVSRSASKTLKNFCKWQRKLNKVNDKHPEHFDTAVLLTRKDLCTSASKCDTLGFAELGTICDLKRSCSVSEDNGLSVAFTVAHELGHLFNSQHDGESNPCTEEKDSVHIMTPSFTLNSKTWTWSSCSRKAITEFLEAGHGHCLFDKPSSEAKHHLPLKLPGETFTANEQCALVFGNNASTCPYTKSCERLWCTKRHGNKNACYTNNMPWADGTSCGKSMWCIRGSCQLREKLYPLNGKWGAWRPFGACSRSCGGGITFSERECDNPIPRNGGTYCVGKRRRHRSCNTMDCPKTIKSFRSVQCEAFNGKNLNIHGVSPDVSWLAKTRGVRTQDSCRLFCEVEGQSLYYELASRVIDGTECWPGTSNKCVEGKCRPAGCDHVLNSAAKYDSCGVCNGDNSSCRKITGSLNQTRYGYNFVVRIPLGASNLVVSQYSLKPARADTNFLAIMNKDNRYIFNGHFVVSLGSRKYTSNGMDILYSGSDVQNETIVIPGKLTSHVTVKVLSVGNIIPCNIVYSFNMPVVGRQNYSWVLDADWSKCNRLCHGYQWRHYRCLRDADGQLVADEKCPSPKLSAVEEKCNRECRVSWSITAESECSAACGSGYKTRSVECMKKHTNLTLEPETVISKHCARLVKPKKMVRCLSPCSGSKWAYTDWSKCSKECDGGTQTRFAFCVDSLSRKLTDKDCDSSTRGPLTRSCNNIGCPQWKTGEWGLCSVQCGLGVQHRDVYCTSGLGQITKISVCHQTKRPAVTQPCEMRACPSWQKGAWTRCSVTCGPGTQARKIRCRRSDGELVPDEECEPASRPIDRKDCRARPCPVAAQVKRLPLHDDGSTAVWMTGAWTQCSVSCGEGIQERYVSCRYTNGEVADVSLCRAADQPSEMKVCSPKGCPLWKTSPWSECTTVCGGGSQTRAVRCSNEEGLVTDDHKCAGHEKPTEKRACNDHKCATTESEVKEENSGGLAGKWKFGSWSPCSVTCGIGTRQRLVTCDSEAEGGCDEGAKPIIMKACSAGPCPGWNYGAWTECSQSCGQGEQLRHVVCQFTNGSSTVDRKCNGTFKPSDRRTCKMTECPQVPRWNSGPWQPCSVTCGSGFIFRDVTCENSKGDRLHETECADMQKPKQQTPCRLPLCARWITGQWTECNSDCKKQREVSCVHGDKNVTDANLCSLESKPTETAECDDGNCIQDAYKWHVGDWTPCARTCGYSVRRRGLWCRNARGRQVAQAYCSKTRPKTIEACSLGPCVAQWIAGEWSTCSSSCDSGVQRRRVSCDTPPGSVAKSCPIKQRPAAWQICNLGKCNESFHWRTGSWSMCSAECGGGISKRAVICVDTKGRTQKEELCAAEKPGNARVCNSPDCPARSCRDIKRLTRLNFDGEHFIILKGNRQLQVYCEGMSRSNPREYITLKADPRENYSEIYGKRLSYRGQCPSNNTGSRLCEDCLDYAASGSTYFSKVRIDVRKMVLLTDDKKFTVKFGRNPPPFASAGDCFSRKKCPQGRFSVNLKGTKLFIQEDVTWSTRGYHTAQRIRRHSDGQGVFGECGGYCGMCSPSRTTGLKVAMMPA